MIETYKHVDQIANREDLVAFIVALRADLASAPEKWENPTLDRFLGALASWTEDMDGAFKYKGEPTPGTPTWRTFGLMLLAASVYE
jgi:hypothetical protein